MEETLRSHLLELCRLHGTSSEMTPGAIGKAALRDHTFFRRVEAGENFTVKTFDRAVQWFSDHWFESAEWPEGIERPKRAPTPMPEPAS